jgi:hypothetical protein
VVKALWTAVSVLAVVNLLLLGGGLGWLAKSGRLDGARIREVRAILSDTAAEREAAAKAAEKQAAIDQAAAEEALVAARPPVTAAEELKLRLLESQADSERLERLKREVQDLRDAVARERRLLEDRWAELERERGAFEAMRRAVADADGDEQFARALVVLEKMSPVDAKKTLSAMLDRGEKMQVVSYLNSMGDRPRTAVLSEFVKDTQTPLAAELLEELRTRGIGDLPPPEVPGG